MEGDRHREAEPLLEISVTPLAPLCHRCCQVSLTAGSVAYCTKIDNIIVL